MTMFIYARDILGAVAASDNKLPWDHHNKVDMRYFKAETDNKLVLCGLNTFNSLPGFAIDRMKPLILVNSDTDKETLVSILNKGGRPITLDILKPLLPELVVIGGMKLFMKLIPLLDEVTLFVTTKLSVYNGDLIRDNILLNSLTINTITGVYADNDIMITKFTAKVNIPKVINPYIWVSPEVFKWPNNDTILCIQGDAKCNSI